MTFQEIQNVINEAQSLKDGWSNSERTYAFDEKHIKAARAFIGCLGINYLPNEARYYSHALSFSWDAINNGVDITVSCKNHDSWDIYIKYCNKDIPNGTLDMSGESTLPFGFVASYVTLILAHFRKWNER